MVDSKQLVSIGRENIDDNDISGVILKETPALLLVQEVYDFAIDGLKVLRQADISDISQFNTDIFQTDRLKELGLYAKIPFDSPYKIDSWHDFFVSAMSNFDFFTIEDECSDAFNLGKIEAIESDKIIMQTCGGAGNWHDKPTEIFYRDITCAQVGNRYAQVYQDFMMGVR